VGLAVALLGVVVAPQAGAATTIGQTFTPTNDCTGPIIWTQTTSPGNAYAVPSRGVITSWAFEAAGTTDAVRFKLIRPAGGNNFTVIGEGDLVLPAQGQLNTYAIRIPVVAGDLIALFVQSGLQCAIPQSPPGSYVQSTHNGDLAPGMTDTFNPGAFTFQTDLSAVLEPDADNDGFGDETQDLCPSDGAIHTDCTPPDTQLLKGPKEKTKKKIATFEFNSTEPGSTFECSLDGAAFAACASPDTLKVKKGKHTFAVRSTDAAGNADTSPASDDWKVKKRKKK
jgi:hypothetical protein